VPNPAAAGTAAENRAHVLLLVMGRR